MKFSMNIYYDANSLVRKNNKKVVNDVFERFSENDSADLYNMLDNIEDENLADSLAEFFENATNKELKEYITVDVDSIRYDDYETSECNRGTVAYLVDVDFDVDKFTSKTQDV